MISNLCSVSKNSPLLTLSLFLLPHCYSLSSLLSLYLPIYSKKYNFCRISSTLPLIQEAALLQRAGRGAKNQANCHVRAKDEGDTHICFQTYDEKNNLLATTIFQKFLKSSNSNKDSFLTLGK